MFEQQYDDEMTAEILRLEGKQRAAAAGHPEWEDACPVCRSRVAAGAACEWCPGEAASRG
jgi:hypothetical protein